MSAFVIYAFVVTGIYIVYMSVAILMDLFGKKGQKKDTAEVFNNSDMSGDDDDSEGGTLVDETPDGYSTRDANVVDIDSPDDDSDDDSSSVADDEVEQEEQVVDDNPDDDSLLNHECKESQAYYESLKAVQDQMDPVSPHYQDEYRSSDFAAMMAQPMSQKSRILRSFVNI